MIGQIPVIFIGVMGDQVLLELKDMVRFHLNHILKMYYQMKFIHHGRERH